MSKMYVKDTNGKYRLVDKDKQEPQKPAQTQPLTLEVVDARLKRLEEILLAGGQRK